MLPIETVVELLMVHSYPTIAAPTVYRVEVRDFDTLQADSPEDLRTKVRDYLLTLVPKPVLLSECEEYKNVTTQDETIVYRVGKDVYRSVDNMWVGYADRVQVIQPVEVQ